MSDKIGKYVKNLETWTSRKTARVCAENYLKETYGWQHQEAVDTLDGFSNIRTEFLKPLSVVSKYMDNGLLLETFRRKLLLKTLKPEEAKIVSISSLYMKLDLPPHLQVNPESKRGMYFMDENDQANYEKYNVLFATALVEIDGIHFHFDVPYDFLLAHAPFRPICESVYEDLVTQRNIRETLEASKKHGVSLHLS